jgi:hypothetical protein
MQNVLITNGGPHSPEKWAEATASNIVDIAQHVAGEKRAAAVKLQAAIIDILEGHHAAVQNGERAQIAAIGHDRLQAPNNPDDHLSLDDAVAQIIQAAKGTPWEADFANPEMAPNIKALLSSHFATSIQIERSWHADRNPGVPQAVAFRNQFHSGV